MHWPKKNQIIPVCIILGKVREASLSGLEISGWAVLTQRKSFSPIFVSGELFTGYGNESLIVHFVRNGIIPLDNCSSIIQVCENF